MPTKEKIAGSLAARFSAAAKTYHELAAVQIQAAQRLLELLPSAQPPGKILEIGCGTGVLTSMLARKFPSACIDAVDISSAMISKARVNLNGNKMINWIVADARHISPAAKYPLIASSCSLHWIMPLEPVLAKLGAMLDLDGYLAMAIMTHGTLAELQESRSRIAPHKPPRIAMPLETNVREAVAKSGLAIITEKSETSRHNYSSAKEILRQLHLQGLTGGNYPAGNSLLTRSEMFQLIDYYNSNYNNNGGVFASYRLYCCIAGKK